MLRSLNICTRCRCSLTQHNGPEAWLGTQARITRRHRTTKSGSWKGILDDLQPFKKSGRQTGRSSQYPTKRFSNPHRDPSRKILHQVPDISLSQVVPYFEDNVYLWATLNRTKDRLVSFGIPSQDALKLLDGFVEDVEAGLLSDPGNYAYYSLERFSHPQDRDNDNDSIDVLYSTIFFSWATKPENRVKMEQELSVDQRTTHFMERLVKATSRSYPADEFPKARTMHRKIIMHVGPTNSGKTYHALQALAAARTGVYAGPLRLLAHEIWHRLNTGQILPPGAEPESNDSGVAGATSKYARLCNMITGEERKIMSPDAPLLSCTVEMMSFRPEYDVAVIDEIQMIGSRSRGGGWMSAVLGVCAREVHLCGEETAVPVVKALLRHTGDEIVVKRYERLTPLVVENESLGADLSKVREGDCIVAFSRNKIFDLKRRVEAQTGMRCAVVYGRLPPEIRNEQAMLFNKPDSGYEVIIGSDAIGMGLNLKIKRVIFEATRKYEEGAMRLLSDSTIKQIAGRAGRFGLHQSDSGGTATTLYPNDLSDLTRGMATPHQPLHYAFIGHSSRLLDATLSILPPGTAMMLALSAPKYIGRLPSFVRCAVHERLNVVSTFIDDEWSHMSNDDKVMLLYAPIPWADVQTASIIEKMLIQHAQDFSVKIATSIKGQGFVETLESVEAMMENQQLKFSSNPTTLMLLEAFHKVLVFYKWMYFRNPIVYSDPSVSELKDRSEKVLNWTLEKMSKVPKGQVQAAIPSPGNDVTLAKPKAKLKEDVQSIPYGAADISHLDINLLPLHIE